jgi:hypothetical protein
MAEPDTKELDALLASLNGSAERFQTLWFSFLGLTPYLAITALATTHRMLLREALLARTAAQFEKQLRTKRPRPDDQERCRARVENALFLQWLVGMKDERSGVNALLLATIALITIVLWPVATLVLMQMKFLPYHSFGIKWWRRALVAADLAVVLIMWRSFFYDSGVHNPLLFIRDRPRLRGSGLRRKPRADLCRSMVVAGRRAMGRGRSRMGHQLRRDRAGSRLRPVCGSPDPPE